jgi:penicillin-binding protein A
VLFRKLSGFASACAVLLGLASPARAEAVAVTEDAVTRGPAVAQGARLTLEPRVQRIAQRLLGNARPHEGAIVVSDVKTGRILAWASHGGSSDWVSTPLAPSASVFKIVTATALLERGYVTPTSRQCWSGGEHDVSQINLTAERDLQCAPFGDALGRSINGIFAKLSAKHLAPNDLLSQAALLGFSGPVPIDVASSENTLTIPSDELGLARAGAGFWNGHTSPLGPLFAMTTIANDGERIRLHLVDRGDADTRVSLGRAMSIKTARTLRSMLEVTTKRGTCAKVFHNRDGSRALPNVPVAAKTGTLIGGKPTRMFSWFAGFAPANDPQIAVAVMLANDVSWVRKGNEVGRDLMEAYFAPQGEARTSSRAPTPARRAR